MQPNKGREPQEMPQVPRRQGITVTTSVTRMSMKGRDVR